MKSLEWLQRGLNHDDPMDCLSNCWMGFNNLYSAHQSNSEIQAIKQFIDANVDVGTAQKLIDNHQTEITYFMSRPIIDMRGNGRNSQRDIDSYNSSDAMIIAIVALVKNIKNVVAEIAITRRLNVTKTLGYVSLRFATHFNPQFLSALRS